MPAILEIEERKESYSFNMSSTITNNNNNTTITPTSIAVPPPSKKRKATDVTPLDSLSEHWKYPDSLKVDDSLTCALCSHILKNPYSHDCRVTYCYECFLKAAPLCPRCRVDAFGSSNPIIPAPSFMMDQLQALPVECKKCHTETNLDRFVHHYQHLCPQKCPVPGCTETELKGAIGLTKHTPNCEYVLRKCVGRQTVFQGHIECNWIGYKKDYKAHLESCPFLILDKSEKALYTLSNDHQYKHASLQRQYEKAKQELQQQYEKLRDPFDKQVAKAEADIKALGIKYIPVKSTGIRYSDRPATEAIRLQLEASKKKKEEEQQQNKRQHLADTETGEPDSSQQTTSYFISSQSTASQD